MIPEVTMYFCLHPAIPWFLNSYLVPEYYRVVFNGKASNSRSVPSGIYIARLVTPEYTKSIKMVLLK